jgi:hypothetical protein
MNLKKYISNLGIGVALLSLVTLNVSAKDFTRVYVDSNTFGNVVTAQKDGKANPSVKVTNIYKANGTVSSYKYIRVNVVSNGTTVSLSGNIKVKKGTIAEIPIIANCKKIGKSLTLRAMGNNASLDCQISGNFSAN